METVRVVLDLTDDEIKTMREFGAFMEDIAHKNASLKSADSLWKVGHKLLAALPKPETKTITVTWFPEVIELVRAIRANGPIVDVPNIWADLSHLSHEVLWTLLTNCIRNGLVQKEAWGYSLTTAGIELAEATPLQEEEK